MAARWVLASALICALNLAPAASGPVMARSAIAPTSEQRLPDGQRLLVLCYHDVVPARAAGMDPEAIETATLAAQLNWLQTEHYVAVDLDQVERAYAGTARLPDRAVLLTFDDGYESIYTQAFPLLKAFRMPAVVALVGRWLETPDGEPVHYGDHELARDRFITWEQARRMRASGLIEFASHSWDLHHGVAGDAAGSLEPAATTRQFLGSAGYEDDAAWSARVRSDLERNSALLERRLGQRPRAIVWPYGRYNDAAEHIAADLGMPIGLTLDAGRDDRAVPISRVRRLLVDADPGLARFARLVRQQDDAPVMRAVQIDPAHLIQGGAAGIERRLDELAVSIRQLGVQTVVVQAFADPDAGGRADALYFPNRHLPVRADVLGRIAWKIASTTQARVWAWMPMDGYAQNLHPDDPDAQARIGDLFEDLGKSAYLSGVLIGPAPAALEPETLSVRAAGLAQRTRAWQPELRSAVRLQADSGTASIGGLMQAVLKRHDFVMIGRSADDRELAALVRSIPDASPRTVIALQASGEPAAASSQAQALMRAGLPNVCLFGARLDGAEAEAAVAALRPALSVQSRLAPTPSRGLP